MAIRPEEVTENQSQRIDIVKAVLSTQIVDPPLAFFTAQVAAEERTPIDLLDADGADLAKQRAHEYQHHKQELIDIIVNSPIDTQELPHYLQLLIDLGQLLVSFGGTLTLSRLITIAKMPNSLASAQQYLSFAQRWNTQLIDTITDTRQQNIRLRALNQYLTILTEQGNNLQSLPLTLAESDQLSNLYLDVYQFTTTLPLLYAEAGTRLLSELVAIGVKNHDLASVDLLAKEGKRVLLSESASLANKYIIIVGHYARLHGLTATAMTGFATTFLPALRNNNPELAVFQRGGNLWGVNRNDFGIADFICHCYTQVVQPSSLNELVLISRELPAVSSTLLEQNRLDGISITPVFDRLRDFIHQQRPGVHELITAMINFYEADEQSVAAKRQHLKSLLQQNPDYFSKPESQVPFLEKNRYDEIVTEQVNNVQHPTSAINILRRLQKNTQPQQIKPPSTADPALNVAMAMAAEQALEHQRLLQPELAELLSSINERIIEMINQSAIGLDPSLVVAISWIERQAHTALQQLSFEDQMTAFRQPWFKEVLLFTELTASPTAFDQTIFETWWQQIISNKNSIDAYRLIAQHLLHNLDTLAAKYRHDHQYRRGALWSGNLVHTLIGLTDPATAQTVYGQKYRQEKMTPEYGRQTGD